MHQIFNNAKILSALCIAVRFYKSLFLNSCDKMELRMAMNLPKYSTDTIRFDTVFTTLGSAIRIFKIYNPYDKFLKIQK
ncbi:MAG: hypothetical protein IPJ43_00005 [Saprospiraceae bacterium]|nr:hypothetical protein [Saprospiraceae bacterium]